MPETGIGSLKQPAVKLLESKNYWARKRFRGEG